MKELKGYYKKESHWLLTFLLSQKIDFITFFLVKNTYQNICQTMTGHKLLYQILQTSLLSYFFIYLYQLTGKKGQVS